LTSALRQQQQQQQFNESVTSNQICPPWPVSHQRGRLKYTAENNLPFSTNISAYLENASPL